MDRETQIKNELIKRLAKIYPEECSSILRSLNREYDKHGAILQ